MRRRLMMIALLAVAIPANGQAIEIGVTPSVLNLDSATGVVNGFVLSEAAQGDEFTLGFSVENRDGDDINSLFTSILYDPNVLRFLGGAADSILEDPPGGGFGTISLSPLRAPEPRSGSPLGTLLGLTHVAPLPGVGQDFPVTTAIGPDLAISVTFEILDPSIPTTVRQAFLSGDAARVNDFVYCGVGTSPGACQANVPADTIFDFQDFAIVPEPSAALLLGLGLAALAQKRREGVACRRSIYVPRRDLCLAQPAEVKTRSA